jgi:uncharacterized protein
VSEAFTAALGYDGLWWLILAVTLGGIVRGFAGFGTALVFIPLAAPILPPVWVLITIIIYDFFGPIPLIPRALRDADKREIGLLALGTLLTLPVGVWLLTRVDPTVFRWFVSGFAFALLTVLIAGWRHRATLNRFATFLVGSASGLMGGFAGLPGPPVILFYLSGPKPPAVVRANSLLFLVLYNVMIGGTFATKGLLDWRPVMIGLLLIVPYTLGGMIGAAIFDPARERIYRRVAYAIIGASALVGLPLFD